MITGPKRDHLNTVLEFVQFSNGSSFLMPTVYGLSLLLFESVLKRKVNRLTYILRIRFCLSENKVKQAHTSLCGVTQKVELGPCCCATVSIIAHGRS
jgi:hypothetical protein